MPHALEASKRTGIDPRIIVAQAAQETGWGKSAPGNNYFGIKSHGKGGGQTFGTHEYINGKRVNIRDSFRQYGTPGDSVAGYADFMLNNKRYAPMRQAQGLEAQLAALGKSGYATDPNYARSVGAIAKSIPMGPQLDQSQLDFVKNNPQPGGFGPGIPDPNATPAPDRPVSPSFPVNQGPSNIPVEVAQYAAADENQPNMLQRIGAALSGMEGSAPRPPSAGFGGGAGSGSQLLNYLHSPKFHELLAEKRRV